LQDLVDLLTFVDLSSQLWEKDGFLAQSNLHDQFQQLTNEFRARKNEGNISIIWVIHLLCQKRLNGIIFVFLGLYFVKNIGFSRI
jgi:hypothetical protein